MADPEEIMQLKERVAAKLKEAGERAARFDALEAARLFGEAREACRGERALRPLAARALLGLAALDEAAGRLDEALARLGEAFEMAEALDAPDLAARAHTGTGLCLLHRRDLPRALSALERAEERARAAGNAEGTLHAKILLAHARDLDGRHDEAEAALRSARDKLVRHLANGYDTPEIRELACLACSRLAVGLLRRKRADEAEAILREGLAATGGVERSLAKAECLRYLGVARSARRAFVEAIDLYAQSLSILKYCYHAPQLARLYASIGRTWLDAGDLGQAQQGFVKARALCLKLALASNVAEFDSLLGHIARRREDFAEAKRLYLEDLEITRGLDDRLALGYARRNLAAACLGLGETAEAGGHVAEAERLFGEAKSRHNLALTLLLAGRWRLARGEREAAREAAARAEEIFHALERFEDLGHVERLLGLVELAEGDAEAAAGRFARAVARFRDARLPFPLLEATEELAGALARAGRRDLALRACGEAAALAEKHRLERAAERIARTVEGLDEAGGIELSAARLSAAGQAEQKEEKERAVTRAASSGESVHVLAGLSGLDGLVERLGRDRAQAVASRLVSAIAFTLAETDCRLNFNAGFALSFIAGPDEGGAPGLGRALAKTVEAAREVARILDEEFGGEAPPLPVAFLVDLAPLHFLPFTVGSTRENFPVSDRVREALALLLGLNAHPGVSVHLHADAAGRLPPDAAGALAAETVAGVRLVRVPLGG